MSAAHAYTAGDLERIAKALGGESHSGDRWKARCPCHDDDKPSLTLNLGEGGKLLWRCHAGCDQAAVLDRLKKRGLLMNGSTYKPQTKRRIVSTYDYVDEQGSLLFQKVRYDPKDFRQRRPDGRGGWVYKLGDARRVLYRLPTLGTAEEVIFTEGEKDCDRLRSLGFVATTNVEGASEDTKKPKWRPEYSTALADKRLVFLPDNDGAGQAHVRNAAACCKAGAASVKVIELDGLPPKGDVSDWLAAGHTADELRTLIAEAPEWEPPPEPEAEERPGRSPEEEEPPDPREAAEDKRPLIRIYAGGLHVNAEQAAKVLGGATHGDPFSGVYRRSSLLVRPGRLVNGAELERAGVKRAPGTLTILNVEPDFLVYRLTKLAHWQKWDGRSEDWVDANAHLPAVKAVIAAADQIGFIPPLAGIVEAPTIRPDGSVLDRPGYDPATRLLFDPGGVDFPPIPANPTREQAEAALATLREPFAEFPFVDEASESVALSMVETALTRKAMRAAPLHANKAPKMASGKTLLATIAGYVATGRAPAMMSQAEDPESERKRLLAVLLEGAPLVVIDNVERPLKSDALCSVLTEPLFTDRLLGLSKTATAPTNALFVCTGNNIAIAGDLTARTIACTVDPMCERPEERRFKLDLHEWVPAHRGELVAAALTIVRAYLAAGEPLRGELPNFARFEDWCRLVREPLVWLGMADPCLTRRSIEERDPVREKLTALLVAWKEVFASTAVTVADAIEAADETKTDPDAAFAGRLVPKNPALKEAVTVIADERGKINSRRLASFIAAHVGRIEGALRFERAGSRQGVALWAVGSVGSVGQSASYAENCQGPKDRNRANYNGSAGTDPPNPPNPPNGAAESVSRPFKVML